MARKHVFAIVVLLAAAVLAGFVALTRSADLAQPAEATGTPALSQSAVDARLRQLGRFEKKLRKELAAKPPVRRSAPVLIQRQAAPAPATAFDEDEPEDEWEDEGEDD